MVITKKQLKALKRKAEIKIGPKPWIVLEKSNNTGEYSHNRGPKYKSIKDYCAAEGINEEDYDFIVCTWF